MTFGGCWQRSLLQPSVGFTLLSVHTHQITAVDPAVWRRFNKVNTVKDSWTAWTCAVHQHWRTEMMKLSLHVYRVSILSNWPRSRASREDPRSHRQTDRELEDIWMYLEFLPKPGVAMSTFPERLDAGPVMLEGPEAAGSPRGLQVQDGGSLDGTIITATGRLLTDVCLWLHTLWFI